jgi:hypothetical protein
VAQNDSGAIAPPRFSQSLEGVQMKRDMKWLLFFCLFIPCLSSAGLMDFFRSGTSEDLQHDFDIVRLKDLSTLSGYIEKYKEITGKYPFEGEVNIPHYVHIATKEQEQYAKGGPPYKHKKTSAKDFIKELQSKLGNDIQIPFDLQRVPVNKPNFYIYMVMGDVYFLAVHVHNDFSFANKIADYYYKVEVTNNSNAKSKGTWLRSELLANQSYIGAINVKPKKPDYAEELRNRLGGNNAF